MNITLLAAEGEQGAEESSNFLIPNGTFFVELLIFIVVLAVIWKFVVPPIRAVLQERADRVAKTADDNHRAARAFADADAKYKAELAAARTEATQIRDAARGEGQQVIDEKRAAARSKANAAAAAADQEFAAQAQRVSAQLLDGVGPMSQDLAGRILGTATVSANRGGK